MSILGTAVLGLSAINVAGHIKSTITGSSSDDLMKLGTDYILRDSLISYTKTCRVEPITVVDTRLQFQPYIADVLQTANSIFAGYYLQAISLDCTIGDIKVIQRIDKFNPERSALLYAREDFAQGLPKYSRELEQISMEASNKPYIKQTGANEIEEIRGLKEASNLAVGKIFQVNLKYNDQEFTMPVAIRLDTSTVDPTSLVHILGIGKDNKSATSRYHAWRSGELEFFRDIVLCQDLIKAHRTTLAKDKSGVYAEILKRRNINAVAAAASKELSVATASSIAIISDATAKELEYNVGGKLSNYRNRERLFSDSYMMLLFVVDTEYEHVTIYHRGVANGTDMSLKELKMAAKNNGPDVSDILKSFLNGHAPTF